jgi:glutamate carboxypeptidase
MTWRLTTLVESESPTTEKAAVDALGAWLAEWAHQQGAEVKVHPHPVVGNFIECLWNNHLPLRPITILCHMDTVHPLGSVEKRPTRIEDEVLFGVGAYDMKASLVIVQTVIEQLREHGQLPPRPLRVLFTSDEEIGSPYSRPLIELACIESELVLVMEFCNYEEAIVTERKGVGLFQLTALGREAHAGSAPEAGVNAIVGLARMLEPLLAIADPALGTTLVPAVIRGGTSHNVVPGACDLVINVRVRYHREANRVFDALERLAESVPLPGVELILTGDYMRPPMERDAIMQKTVETLYQVAGVPFGEERRGGGSDGNFSASLGVPTLDGLGASGEGAHSAHEQVYLPSMVSRAGLLAQILTAWPSSPRH